MPRTAPKKPRSTRDDALRGVGSPWRRLTQAAFFISLVLVICRMTMQEVFRGDAPPLPGGQVEPAFAGPTTGLVLDLLACLPALLVVARRLVDARFTLRLAWSHLAMLLLAGWTVASVLWASDKFAAAIQSAHWSSALVLLWSTSQLVNSSLRLRLLASVAFGLLLVLLAQGYYYRFVDLPDFQKDWRAHQQELLRQRGIGVDSREAAQLAANIESGDVTGFSISRNTYAAVLVLLMIVVAGVALQRIADRDSLTSIVPVLIGIVLGLLMLYRFVQSKTAFVTPVIAALLLWLIRARRDWLARHARRAYWGSVGLFVLGAAAVIGHGLKHGTLVHVSLTFRWQYWVGAAHVFIYHPLLGVGWGNFGPFYLMYRLPQAAEEPADPHNFLVRAFVELGIVGGALMIAWMLRLWWELIDAPVALQTAPRDTSVRYRALPFLVWLGAIAMALNCLVSIDWSMGGAWITLELFKRLMFFLALLAGLAVVALRSWKQQDLDDRPAPWVLYAILVGLGLFLLHNLIDFSIFEPGPMFLFALLAGGALAVRLHESEAPSRHPAAALATFVIAGIGWLMAWGGVVVPIAAAEALAQQADAHLRTGDPEKASRELLEAFRHVPLNADYAYRAEQASLVARSDPLVAQQLIDGAVAAHPANARYLRARAQLEASTGALPAAWADYRRALELDPRNMDLRLEFADLLRLHNLGADARAQYEKALEQNDQLAPDEIKRLSPEKVNLIRKWIDALPRS